jgi:hypothetical protein
VTTRTSPPVRKTESGAGLSRRCGVLGGGRRSPSGNSRYSSGPGRVGAWGDDRCAGSGRELSPARASEAHRTTPMTVNAVARTTAVCRPLAVTLFPGRRSGVRLPAAGTSRPLIPRNRRACPTRSRRRGPGRAARRPRARRGCIPPLWERRRDAPPATAPPPAPVEREPAYRSQPLARRRARRHSDRPPRRSAVATRLAVVDSSRARHDAASSRREPSRPREPLRRRLVPRALSRAATSGPRPAEVELRSAAALGAPPVPAAFGSLHAAAASRRAGMPTTAASDPGDAESGPLGAAAGHATAHLSSPRRGPPRGRLRAT